MLDLAQAMADRTSDKPLSDDFDYLMAQFTDTYIYYSIWMSSNSDECLIFEPDLTAVKQIT